MGETWKRLNQNKTHWRQDGVSLGVVPHPVPEVYQSEVSRRLTEHCDHVCAVNTQNYVTKGVAETFPRDVAALSAITLLVAHAPKIVT